MLRGVTSTLDSSRSESADRNDAGSLDEERKKAKNEKKKHTHTKKQKQNKQTPKLREIFEDKKMRKSLNACGASQQNLGSIFLSAAQG